MRQAGTCREEIAVLLEAAIFGYRETKVTILWNHYTGNDHLNYSHR